jgi:class 3 adenylate cyclase
MERYVRPFAEPDELIELETLRSAMVTMGGLTVSYDVHYPGWRWSTHVRPLVKTDWCRVRHLGVIVRGRLALLLEDGTQLEARPTSMVDIPPGHDAWVEGDEPVEMIAWTGVKDWLRPLDTLTERVLATLVFTDLVDSTATAARMGPGAWGELLATHLQQSRDIVARFRGRIVKTTGDGMLVTFDGAARAVRCAIALRDGATGMGLELRTAVLTGEVDVLEDDIRGIAIHEASRMLSLASADRIVVSSTTAGLIRDAGISLEDLGEHELRGIEGPRRIYAIA